MSEPMAVVVTGASRGVGRATAAKLADAGYRVFAGVLSTDEAAAWQDDHVRSGRIVPVALDVTRPHDVAGLLSTLNGEARELSLRALVSVAGLAQFDAIEHIEQQSMRRMFEVNLFGAFSLAQALLPRLKQSRGRLIFVTSMSARVAAPLMGVYSATKAAMESFVDSLRVEMRPWGVSMTMVEPGGIRTIMTEEAIVHLREAAARSAVEGAPSAPLVAAYTALADGIVADKHKYLLPETVASTLVDLVKARKVNARYALGSDAKLVVLLRSLLSDGMLDAILARQFKLAARS